MKLLLVLSVLIICITFSTQKVKYVNCPEDRETHLENNNNCYEVRCSFNKFGKLRFRVDCPDSQCLPGTEFGHREADNSLLFPNCCGEVLCEKKINDTYSIVL